VPYLAAAILERDIHASRASSTDPATWSTFETAVAAYESGTSMDGIGFMLNGKEIVGIDLDECFEDGKLLSWAEDIVKNLASYTERSPSGKGIRVFVKATFMGGIKRGPVELYGTERFLTVTGDHLEGTSLTMEARQEQVDHLLASLGRDEEKSKLPEAGSLSLRDESVLNLAITNGKFANLYKGDLADVPRKADGDPDLSSADLSFCCHLARYSRDHEQIDRIYRASALMRDKWDRDDYRHRTIEKALAQVELERDTVLHLAEEEVDRIIKPVEVSPKAERGHHDDAKGAEVRAAEKAVGEKLVRPGYRFSPIDSTMFAGADYHVEFLVKGVLVHRQLCVIGGPKKSLKTSFLVDLALSLGSEKPFLGKFKVTRPRRTVLISGESGEWTLQETALRICRAKGIQLQDTDTHWDFRLPRLSVEEELAELNRGLAGGRFEVAIIDPLYLCLLSGESKASAANLFDMGPLLLVPHKPSNEPRGCGS
jgi:hypothetical protein